jgi:hypothetical protein
MRANWFNGGTCPDDVSKRPHDDHPTQESNFVSLRLAAVREERRDAQTAEGRMDEGW